MDTQTVYNETMDAERVGTFHVAQLGTATIYYTMEREGSSADS